MTEYYYKGKNLTTVILNKTEQVAELISLREARNFDDCLKDFMLTRTYQNLHSPETLMWGESAAYILDDYDRETII